MPPIATPMPTPMRNPFSSTGTTPKPWTTPMARPVPNCYPKRFQGLCLVGVERSKYNCELHIEHCKLQICVCEFQVVRCEWRIVNWELRVAICELRTANCELANCQCQCQCQCHHHKSGINRTTLSTPAWGPFHSQKGPYPPLSGAVSPAFVE